MIKSELNINDTKKVSIRDGFGDGLLNAAEKDKRVVALCGDLEESVRMAEFKEKFPERFIEVGVAEQNLVTVASGMAAMGKIPFAGSFAIFSPGRNWEQIRTTVCYNNVPVKIVGSHAGLSAALDGGSHQALEDIALARVLPRMVVISPCDAIEAKKATMAAAMTKDPTYIRLNRNATPVMTTEETPFEIGKAQVIFRSKDQMTNDKSNPKFKIGNHSGVGIIATGAVLHQALIVAKKLDGEGKSVAVMNLSTIKPLDEYAVIKLAHETGAMVTVEEHQINGGMGSAVAELLAQHYPVPMEFVGISDKFGQTGKYEELLELYGLDEKNIYSAAQRVMLRRQ
ncbi:transketolase family protein [Patescibacteria group bacterium]|nr:transketolase family protein [Patescibacteria group bacterium]MDE1946297.1 transketolase family protein [Patescibacteria group bacterium]MDE2010749.1 transketolase family protein [Patescibacteria group bacterium]MDE2232634.1 transketolase family protein [Patescibacteria group bacterium]